MSVNFCKKCGTSLEANNIFCVKCGTKINSEPNPNNTYNTTTPKKKSSKKKKIGITFGVIILLFFVAVSASSGGSDSNSTSHITPKLTTEEIKDRAINVTYDELFRNNENHIGKIVHYTGKVIQIQSSYGDNYVIRIGITKNTFSYSDIIWVNYEGSRILKDDIIEFWGEVKGIKKYSALFGQEITVPEVDSLILNVVKKQG